MTVVVIDNESSSLRWPGGIGTRFGLEQWSVIDVDGRDHDDLLRGFGAGTGDRPHAVIAHVEPKE